MAKFKVGDKLEATEYFVLHGGQFSVGEVWEVTKVDAYSGNYYTVAHAGSLEYDIPHEMLDSEHRLRLVPAKPAFKVGDKVRITANEDALGVLNIAWPELQEGTVGTVLDIDLSYKYPYLVAWSGVGKIWTNVKYLEGVELEPEFEVGDTVYLLEGAHGSTYTYSSPTHQRFLERVRDSDISFTDPWTIVTTADEVGDVLIEQDGDTVYILEKFLTKEKPVVTLSENISTKPVPETAEVAKLLEANDFLGHFDAGLLMDVIKLSQHLK